MSFQKEARTAFASRTIMVSDLFNFHFRDTVFTGAVHRVVNVTPQTTQSTGGGKQAREAIVLKPQSDGAGGSNIVVGFMDIGGSECELRSFEDLRNRHHQRFGNLPFDLNEQEVQAFIDRARPFLENEGFEVQVLTAAPPPRAETPTTAPSARAGPNEPTGIQTPPARAPVARPVRNIDRANDESLSIAPFLLVFALGLVVGVLLTYFAMR